MLLTDGALFIQSILLWMVILFFDKQVMFSKSIKALLLFSFAR